MGAARAGLRGILSAIPTEEVGAAISDNENQLLGPHLEHH